MGSCVLTISIERTTRHRLVHCVMIKQAKNKYLTNCTAISNCRTLYVVDFIAGNDTVGSYHCYHLAHSALFFFHLFPCVDLFRLLSFPFIFIFFFKRRIDFLCFFFVVVGKVLTLRVYNVRYVQRRTAPKTRKSCKYKWEYGIRRYSTSALLCCFLVVHRKRLCGRCVERELLSYMQMRINWRRSNGMKWRWGWIFLHK